MLASQNTIKLVPDATRARLIARTAAPPTRPSLTGRKKGARLIVLADANALISDAIRYSRGAFCLMPYLAEQGLIRLLTAAHIDEKVYLGLPAACDHAGAGLTAATRAYETVHRRLLRFVEPGNLMSTDPRVTAAGANDAEDAALAQLGVLFAPSLILTRDHHLRDIGLASDHWADQLVLVKGLAELDDLMWGAAEGVAGVGALAFVGVRGLVNALRGSQVLLGLTLGFSAALTFQYRDRLHALPASAKVRGGPVATQILEQTAAGLGRWQQARASVEAHLVSPAAASSVEVEVALGLVQQDAPVSAAAILSALSYDRQAELSTEELKAVLRQEPAFELVVGRGWRLGHRAGGEL